jgi:hypothetical protein
VADPRYYQVDLPVVDVPTARGFAAEILRRCAEPPIEVAVEARLCLRTVSAVTASLGYRGVIEVELGCAPEQLGGLTGPVSDPNLSWRAWQERSRFGSGMRVASAHAYEQDPLVTWVSLSFDGPTGRERDQQPRV